MRQIIVSLASLGVLAAAYCYNFGVPSVIQQAVGITAQDDTGGGTARQGGRNRETNVVMQPLRDMPFSVVLRTIGTATSVRSVDLVSSVTGEVSEIMLDANRQVEPGEVLVRLDDRTQRLALEIATAERDQAQDTLTRYATLRNTGNSTITDVTLSDANVALRLAEANMEIAQVELDDRTITAPIAGTLGLSDLLPGDYLSTGDPIVTIDESSVLVAEFEVPERSIALLEIGKPVVVGTPTYAGRVFHGSVTAFDTKLDSTTRSATVRAQIDNSDGLLISGMTFAVRMIEATDPLPVLPATAITWDRGGAGIWVEENGSVTREPIAIRYREGARVWVETDVPLGASVVVEGAAKLRPGARVNSTAEPQS
ncbi:efflux RND transporter periplasmic adaptor subunit [Roseobacter sp.]|uniref:efflux RND transporter periplasmic adaptor subunit n=1 Tax=Roseobacter sp. TaxID=1907202 RepID=UPI003299C548